MAAIATANVTYTINKKQIADSGARTFDVSIAFGNGTLTYPSGGVPLLKGSLGCPAVISSFNITNESAGDGFTYKYDATANAIRIYQVPSSAALGSAAPLLELTTAATPAATTLVVRVSGY